MMSFFKRAFKERVHLRDVLSLFGGERRRGGRGISMPDGSPVPVERIMEAFGVTRERAEKISRRSSR